MSGPTLHRLVQPSLLELLSAFAFESLSAAGLITSTVGSATLVGISLSRRRPKQAGKKDSGRRWSEACGLRPLGPRPLRMVCISPAAKKRLAVEPTITGGFLRNGTEKVNVWYRCGPQMVGFGVAGKAPQRRVLRQTPHLPAQAPGPGSTPGRDHAPRERFPA